MLTADLVRARAQGGEVVPRYVGLDDPKALDLARSLLAMFAEHVGHPRGQLEADLKDYLGTGTAFLLHRGLAKLLHDRSEFEIEAVDDPPELRQAVFRAAADAHRGADGGVGPFAREAVLDRVAAARALSPAEVERGLYADLKDEQILARFEACEPRWLLNRYNVALAQAVLLKATELTIHIRGEAPAGYRALFRKIKFFQLLHRVTGSAADGYRILLDGPLSLFQASQKYGLQMALFLPTLLHFRDWRLEAQVRWGKGRGRKVAFHLAPEVGLESINRLTGQWLPEEVRWLPEQFAKLGSDWQISDDGEILDLGGQGVLVPEFVFTHRGTGRRVYLEILGFWNRGALRSRLDLVRRHGPESLILALSKSLATGEDDLGGLPGEVYVFRSSPVAREVAKRLEQFEPRTGRLF